MDHLSLNNRPHLDDQNKCTKKKQQNYSRMFVHAGDKRVNQHPALTALHVIWLRQHNRLVNQLKHINPHWNGDRLYEEAK
jgi:hypothetical protein